MTEKEFESLLTTYLDGQISDNELADLDRAILDRPKFRERFQTEFRLHTLMREGAITRLELNGLGIGKIFRSYGGRNIGSRFALIAAACIVLVGLVLWVWLSPGRVNHRPVVGVCLQVSGSGGVMIERNNKRIVIGQNSPILEGDRILSGPRAQGLMQLTDGVILSLGGGSSVYFIGRTSAKETEILLEQGEALFEVDRREPNENQFVVRTPQTRVTVFGTLFALETQPTRTRITVYEGLVHFRQENTGEVVHVASEQYAETGQGPLQAIQLEALESAEQYMGMTLYPTDDAHLEDGQFLNKQHLYVEGGRRELYLKFRIPEVKKNIQKAILQLTQWIDVGFGTLRFYEGSHTDWTEQNLSVERAPETQQEIARYNGIVGPHQVIKVDVSDLIKQAGQYTIIVKQDPVGDFNDISFGSKESPLGPRLIIYQQQIEQQADFGKGLQRGQELATLGLAQSPNQMTLYPTDDAYLEAGEFANLPYLRVEGQRRVIHLRFDVPDKGIIREARLQLTQLNDVGSGTLKFYEGSHSDWSEHDLSVGRVPTPLWEIGRHTGVVGLNQVVEVDVSDLIHRPGLYTIIVTLDEFGDNDIAFGSKESPLCPKLIVDY